MFGCVCGMCAHVNGSQRLFLDCSLHFTELGTHQFCYSGQGEVAESVLSHCPSTCITGTQYHFTGAWQTQYIQKHYPSPGMYLFQVSEYYTIM